MNYSDYGYFALLALYAASVIGPLLWASNRTTDDLWRPLEWEDGR